MIVNRGDKVEWESQSFGVTSTKRGEVLRVLEPGEKGEEFVPKGTPSSRIKFGGYATPTTYRALVKVIAGNGLELYYTPRVSFLRKIVVESNESEMMRILNEIRRDVKEIKEILVECYG